MRTSGCGVVGLCLLGPCLLGLSACSDEAGSDARVEKAVRPVGSAVWRPCGNIQCAEVQVPIDYAAPELGTIPIAINRAQANAAVEYRGVVFLNPGGPGEGGKAFVAASTPALRTILPGYDFVGFDPRGVGESAPLHCATPITGFSLLKTGGAQAMIDTLRMESRACAAENGLLFDKLGSNQVVADVDRIREALGHDQINFIGVSYGTRLAALYAQTFPEHARAVILDAPVAPIADLTEEGTAQFDALLTAHAAFFRACASGQLACPPDPEDVFHSALASQPTEGDRGLFLTNWKLLLSLPAGRVILAELLRSWASGDQMSSEEMPVMASVNALAGINLLANLTTNCADSVVPPPTASEAELLLESFRQRSPELADQGTAAITCSGWLVQPDPVPVLTALRVPPLVIGGLEDNLTPLAWAQETVSSSPGASLLLSAHYGHSALVNGGLCVFNYVKKYLDALEPAADGARCAAP